MQIFPNGTMRFSRTSQSDLDGNGMPMPADESSLSEVGCTITTLSEDRKGRYEDGKYHDCKYSVTCNLEDVEDKDGESFPLMLDNVMGSFNPRRVTLVHDRWGELGTFQVQRVEVYELTQTVEVWL